MFISEVKALTDDHRIRHCLSELWDFECYRAAIVDNYFQNIYDCYAFLTLMWVNKKELFNIGISEFEKYEIKRQKRAIEDFSTLLYGDKLHWKQYAQFLVSI